MRFGIRASARNFQGLVWLDYGEIDRAITALEESIRLTTQGNPIYNIWYGAILCQAYGALGAIDLGMQVYRAHRVANKDVPNAPSQTGTLISYALFEIASGQLDRAAATLADCVPNAPPWEAMLLFAKIRLALAQANYTEGITLADSALEFMRQYKLGQYLSEVLYLKGMCLLLQGNLQVSRITLEQARTAAKDLGSRRLLWQIIANLAELEPDRAQADSLKAEALEIVDYIANHITRPNLRESFLGFVALGGM